MQLKIRSITNYLDDFLFMALLKLECNRILKFMDICETIGCPVLMEKTEWVSPLMVFLGLLLNGLSLMISMPQDKINKVLRLLKYAVYKKRLP